MKAGGSSITCSAFDSHITSKTLSIFSVMVHGALVPYLGVNDTFCEPGLKNFSLVVHLPDT